MKNDLLKSAGQPLIFGGYPKSGTTLTIGLFDSHPEILAFPIETKCLKRIIPRRRYRSSKYILSRSAIKKIRQLDAQDSYSTPANGRPKFDWPIFCQRVEQLIGRHASKRELMPLLMHCYADATRQTTRKYWSEKSPLNELHLRKARRLWPNLKAIFTIRDPRDVYASYRRKRERDDYQLPMREFLGTWKKSIRKWDRFASRNPGDAFLVQYERLVLDPIGILKPICDALQIQWNDGLLRPSRGGHSWAGNSMHGQHFQNVSSAPIGRHHRSLTHAERIHIELELAEYFERFEWPKQCEGNSSHAA